MSSKGRRLSSGNSTVNLREVLTLLAVVTISSGVKLSLVQSINMSSMSRLRCTELLNED